MLSIDWYLPRPSNPGPARDSIHPISRETALTHDALQVFYEEYLRKRIFADMRALREALGSWCGFARGKISGGLSSAYEVLRAVPRRGDGYEIVACARSARAGDDTVLLGYVRETNLIAADLMRHTPEGALS